MHIKTMKSPQMTIHKDALQLKKIFEAGNDPFIPASEEEAKSRKEAEVLRRREQAKARYGEAIARAKADGLRTVWMEITDQGDISWDEYGEFYYDEDEDILVAKNDKVLTRAELEEEYQEDWSLGMPCGIRVVFIGDLIHLRDDLNEIIEREQRITGENT